MVHGVTVGDLAGDPPNPILFLPDLHKLERPRHELTVLRMRKDVTPGLDCTIVFDGIDLDAAGYWFTRQYIIFFEKVAESVVCLLIGPNAFIVLVEFKARIKKRHHSRQVAIVEGTKLQRILRTISLYKGSLAGSWPKVAATDIQPRRVRRYFIISTTVF